MGMKVEQNLYIEFNNRRVIRGIDRHHNPSETILPTVRDRVLIFQDMTWSKYVCLDDIWEGERMKDITAFCKTHSAGESSILGVSLTFAGQRYTRLRLHSGYVFLRDIVHEWMVPKKNRDPGWELAHPEYSFKMEFVVSRNGNSEPIFQSEEEYINSNWGI